MLKPRPPANVTTRLDRRSFVRGFSVFGLLMLGACSAPAQPTAPPAPTTAAPAGAAKPADVAAPTPTAAASATAAGQPATKAPAPVRAMKKVRLGTVPPFFFQAPIPYGVSKGYFAEEGIDLELVHFDGDPLALKALLAGEVDFSTYNGSSQVLGAAKGDTKIIGSFQPLNSFVIAARKEIRALDELEGKTFAASAPKSLPHLAYTVLMEKSGLDPSKVQMVGIPGGPATLQAMAAGKADAGMLDQAFVPQLDANGCHVLSVLAESLPELLFDATATSNEYLASNADAVLGMTRAIVRSVRGAYDDRDGVIKEEVERLALPQPVIEFSYDQYTRYNVWSPDFLVAPEQIAFMQEVNHKFELQDTTVPVEQVATWEFQQRAVAELGPYRRSS